MEVICQKMTLTNSHFHHLERLTVKDMKRRDKEVGANGWEVLAELI